jgi:hypothetical protein
MGRTIALGGKDTDDLNRRIDDAWIELGLTASAREVENQVQREGYSIWALWVDATKEQESRWRYVRSRRPGARRVLKPAPLATAGESLSFVELVKPLIALNSPSALPVAEPLAPPLVWPIGLRQRKDADPTFKIPLFSPRFEGSERLFLSSQTDERLRSVRASLAGREVGFWPSLPGNGFVELEWKRNPQVVNIATSNGWRDEFLAYESNRESLEAAGAVSAAHPDDKDWQWFAGSLKLMKGRMEATTKVLPRDLAAWKVEPHSIPLEVSYLPANGANLPLKARGALTLNMERRWFRFTQQAGGSTDIF